MSDEGLVKFPWNSECGCPPDRGCSQCAAPRPPAKAPDVREDMAALLLELRRLVGELDRLLETSK